MDRFATFLDVDSAEGHEEQKAARHASVLFNQRASERFLSFLRQSAHQDEFEARLSLIERDLDRMAAEITEETGRDATCMVEHYKSHVAGGAFCDNCRKWKSGPKAGLCVCDEKDDSDEDGDSVESSVKEASAPVGTTVPFRVVATGEDSLGGKGEPSPKIDKSKAGDEKSNKKRAPIDTDGGPYKTERQDIADGADYTKDFREQTDAVAKHDVDVAKKSEVKGDHTDTWHGKGDQANPVTSHFLSSEDTDRAIESFKTATEAQCADCGTKLATKVNEDGISRCEQCARNVEQAELNEQRDKPPLDK